MENNRVKVHVKNKEDHSEAKELLMELGLLWEIERGDEKTGYFLKSTSTETTLPQLRDMVVLKRNNVADATHTGTVYALQKGYLASDGLEYFWNYHLDKWNMSLSTTFVEQGLKPIEKPMKEYINKTTGEYRKTAEKVTGEQWVEVPKGKDLAYKFDGGLICFVGLEMGYRDAELIWQRHKKPEELPFIDDEPKHAHYFKDVSDINEIDVYEVLKRFNVTDPCLQHIVKKALCAGNRGHKDFETDLKNIYDTAKRALEINHIK